MSFKALNQETFVENPRLLLLLQQGAPEIDLNTGLRALSENFV